MIKGRRMKEGRTDVCRGVSARGAGGRKVEVGEVFKPLGLEHPFSFSFSFEYRLQ